MSNSVTVPEIDFSTRYSSWVTDPGITVSVCTFVRLNWLFGATEAGAVALIVMSMLCAPMIGNAHEYVSVAEVCASAGVDPSAATPAPAAASVAAAAAMRAVVMRRKMCSPFFEARSVLRQDLRRPPGPVARWSASDGLHGYRLVTGTCAVVPAACRRCPGNSLWARRGSPRASRD